jgi:hypothetical protein
MLSTIEPLCPNHVKKKQNKINKKRNESRYPWKGLRKSDWKFFRMNAKRPSGRYFGSAFGDE